MTAIDQRHSYKARREDGKGLPRLVEGLFSFLLRSSSEAIEYFFDDRMTQTSPVDLDQGPRLAARIVMRWLARVGRTMANSGVATAAHRLLPILGWIPNYRRDWLLPDVLAGLALWAVMVPEGMAYAGIVGVPPTVTVGTIAAQGTVEFNSLTSTLAVLIGLFFFSFGVMRMGWVVSFIPTPVMRGFIEGLVYVTIIGRVLHLLGISGASGNFFTRLWHILQHLPDVSFAPALTGLQDGWVP